MKEKKVPLHSTPEQRISLERWIMRKGIRDLFELTDVTVIVDELDKLVTPDIPQFESMTPQERKQHYKQLLFKGKGRKR